MENSQDEIPNAGTLAISATGGSGLSASSNLSDMRNTCHLCNKMFSRAEHLSRHMSIHEEEKKHNCTMCNRKFSRKDALVRHQKTHTPNYLETVPKLPKRRNIRACGECRRARVKCTRMLPCSYCVKRGLECHYDPRKRARPEVIEVNDGSPKTSSPIPSTSANQHEHSAQSEETLSNSQGTASSQTYIPTPTTSGIGNNPSNLSDSLLNSATMSLLFSEAGGLGAGQAVSTMTPLSSSHVDQYPTSLIQSSDRQTNQYHDESIPLMGEPFINIWNSEVNWLPYGPTTHFELPPDNTSLLGSKAARKGSDYHLTQQHERDKVTSSASPHASDLHSEIAQPQPLRRDQTQQRLPSSILRNIDDINAKSRDKRHKTRYYLDGAGARDPYTKDAKSARSGARKVARFPSNDFVLSISGAGATYHDSLDEMVQRLTLSPDIQSLVSSETYTELRLKVDSSGNSPVQVHEKFSAEHPSINTICWLIGIYFKRFHSVFPFIDKFHLNIPSLGWSISLATAAIGARYVDYSEAEACADSLSMLLHRLLTWEYDLNLTEVSLFYTQACALNVIGLWYSREKQLTELGQKQAHKLFAACSQLGLLCENSIPDDLRVDNTQLETSWIRWCLQEERRRTGLFIWILDCILALVSGASARFSLKQMQLRLPSSEDLWSASSSQSWSELIGHEPQSETVKDVLQKLYFHRRLNPRFSEFAKTGLIYALIYRMWDVERHFLDPLAIWKVTCPNGQRAPPVVGMSRDSYPASISEISKWRNVTCDVLDVLHWDVHRVCSENRPTEQPVCLSLHLSRAVLLAPVTAFESMLRLRHGPTIEFGSLPHDTSLPVLSFSECDQTIRTWLNQDKYKARLAIVHSAAIFWHVRRYSSDSFLQPFAIFLASIVVWAYGTYTFEDEQKILAQHHLLEPSIRNQQDMLEDGVNRMRQQSLSATELLDHEDGDEMRDEGLFGEEPCISETESISSTISSGSPEIPSFFNIDRPSDDEMVQNFIKAGPLIRIFMEGVGDVCTPNGPRLVLRQGARLLKKYSANVWPLANAYAKALEMAAASLYN